MKYNNVEIDDTYAEAFGIQVSRVLITAATEYYAKVAATEATGFGAVYFAGVPWAKLPNPLSPYWTQYALWRSVTDTFVYWLILAAGFALHIYDENRAREQQSAELQRSLVAAQVEALKMKLQPHFLFNTLNSIASLIPENPRQAEDTVSRLATLLRFSLDASQRSLDRVNAMAAEAKAYCEANGGEAPPGYFLIDPALAGP